MSGELSYEEALQYIASLEARGWRLGLDRMEEFARRLDLAGSLGEPGGPQFIHVAGTNGKGSVTAYLQSMLIESGYSTGAFFSPFVYDPRERIQIGRRLIPKKIFALLTEWIRPFGESLAETPYEGVTEFEFKTAMGLQFWKEMEVEWVALEVGLGGRLDSTNIVTPRCSCIVSIGLDHTQLLGDTVDQIAEEKAGIIKPGVPTVIGELPLEASQRIKAIAKDRDSELWELGLEIQLVQASSSEWTVSTPAGSHAGLIPGIPGVMQPQNMAIAVAAMDASGATRTLTGLQRGSFDAKIPGRMQRVRSGDREFLLDGAHNKDAAAVLAKSLTASGDAKRRIVMVTGMVKGHDPEGLYQELGDVVDSVHFAPIDFHRAADPFELESLVGSMFASSQAHRSLEVALANAIDEADPEDLILVTGSFYLVGEVGRLLGLCDQDAND
ncbi:MAG: bifunctional folylpolyglutamate synthase/dihydrofolate synthase [Fimbriimonadaceae bacterium]|nr:bifunctional folylpolyglutamate synthase/dihydrofolate synthase [Fimbriimonadaceae bacterium]